MQAMFIFLGTGASTGVPVIGCDCPVCRSSDPRNRRLRPSGLLRIGDKALLIDIGPDFRQQALAQNLTNLDGLLLTHTHYDHIAGIDELRVINFRQNRPFPCLLSKESLSDLHLRYYYLFKKAAEGTSSSAQIDCRALPSDAGEIDFEGIKISYTSYMQGNMKVNGFRVGNFAYVTDIRRYKNDIFSFLHGVDQLVLSALRSDPSPVHFSLQEAAEFASKVGAKHTWLTHLSHAVDHERACQTLPHNVQPGFDGQKIFFEV